MENQRKKIKSLAKITKKSQILISKISDKVYFLKGKNVGIATSGGIDSMVLLDLINRFSKELQIKLYALHFDHKWRKESPQDFKLIKKYCKVNNIKLIWGENKTGVINNEELAREQRYSFFEEKAKKHKINYICTAHHRDDFIETIIFRILRGTGPKGLMPIKDFYKYSENLTLYRPILNLTKEELFKYAALNKIQFNEDSTNNDTSHKRNFIRRKIIPLLRGVNKKFDQNILDLSDLIFSQDNALDTLYRNNSKIISSTRDYIKIDKRRFLALNEHEKKSLIYWLMTRIKIKGNLSKIQDILEAIQKSKKTSLSKNVFLTFTENDIFFGPERLKKPLSSKSQLLTFKVISPNEFKGEYPQDKSMTAYANLSSYKTKDLKVRFRSAKDIFQPLGFKKNTKLKNYLINKKISKEERYNLPLLCFKNEVLWIPGYSISEKIKVTKKPTHFLKLSKSE